VQNRYNLTDRSSEDVLNYCERGKIGFIPWAPLSAGTLARSGSHLNEIADRLKLTPGQVALAWLLKRSPVMLPIPGTANPEHLGQNVTSASVQLTDMEFQSLDHQGREAWEREKDA
jgi:aryl-alcohol dehydrogenase-like predicted oxidoreductase